MNLLKPLEESHTVLLVGLQGSQLLRNSSKNEVINTEKYLAQLDILKATIQKKLPSLANRQDVALHSDNVRPHVSVSTV